MKILRISNPFFSRLTTVAAVAREEMKLGSAASYLDSNCLSTNGRIPPWR